MIIDLVDDSIALIRNANRYVFREDNSDVLMLLDNSLYAVKAILNGYLETKEGKIYRYLGRISNESLLDFAKNAINRSYKIKEIFSNFLEKDKLILEINKLVNDDIDEAFNIFASNKLDFSKILYETCSLMNYKVSEIKSEQYLNISKELLYIKSHLHEMPFNFDTFYELKENDKIEGHFSFEYSNNGSLLLSIFFNDFSSYLYNRYKNTKFPEIKETIRSIFLDSISFNLTNAEPIIDVEVKNKPFSYKEFDTFSYLSTQGLCLVNYISTVIYPLIENTLNKIIKVIDICINKSFYDKSLKDEVSPVVLIKLVENKDFFPEPLSVSYDDKSLNILRLPVLRDHTFHEPYSIIDDVVLIHFEAGELTYDDENPTYLFDEIYLEALSLKNKLPKSVYSEKIDVKTGQSTYVSLLLKIDSIIQKVGCPKTIIVRDYIVEKAIFDLFNLFGYPTDVIKLLTN